MIGTSGGALDPSQVFAAGVVMPRRVLALRYVATCWIGMSCSTPTRPGKRVLSVDDVTDRLREQAKHERDRHVAYHEAAHAVVAHVYDRELISVSIDNGQTVIKDERGDTILNATGTLPQPISNTSCRASKSPWPAILARLLGSAMPYLALSQETLLARMTFYSA